MAAVIALGSVPANRQVLQQSDIPLLIRLHLYNGAGTSTGVVVSIKKKVRLTN